jgi:hypothetical protein
MVLTERLKLNLACTFIWRQRQEWVEHKQPNSITPLEFWGEGYVFHPEFGSVVQRHAWISSAVAYVTFHLLENTWHEIKYCLDILWATYGADIEIYWTWWDVLSSKANQFSVSHNTLCFFCLLEMWWIKYGHPVHSLCVYYFLYTQKYVYSKSPACMVNSFQRFPCKLKTAKSSSG